MKKVRIGCGSGCCKDRIEPVEELIEKGLLDYLIFETLSERSFANLQTQKIEDKDKGFNEMLEVRMHRTLKNSIDKNIKIITNMGGANPIAASKVVSNIAKELGLCIKIAVIEGDDIFPNIKHYIKNERWQYPGETLDDLNCELYYANAYLGGESISEALKNGADIIITGRIADAALFSGPLMYEFGWELNHPHIGQAILAGHLLECCGQITGGFFADPGKKDVPRLEYLGFPIAEVSEDGTFIVTKVEGSGGIVSIDTCKEQLLYEITDPTCYKTPDAIVDFSNVCFQQLKQDVVKVTGAISKGVPETLKVNIGYTNGFTSTGIVTFAGSNSLKLAELCADIIWKRTQIVGINPIDSRTDYVGYNSLCKTATSDYYSGDNHSEIMLRMSIRTKTEEEAKLFADEFGFLYTNGPASSTGIDTKITKSHSVTSIFIPATDIVTKITYKEVLL